MLPRRVPAYPLRLSTCAAASRIRSRVRRDFGSAPLAADLVVFRGIGRSYGAVRWPAPADSRRGPDGVELRVVEFTGLVLLVGAGVRPVSWGISVEQPPCPIFNIV